MDKLVKTSVFLIDLADFQAMNEVYASRVGDRPPGALDVPGREAPVRRARRDRGRRAPVGAGPQARHRRRIAPVPTEIRRYVRSLGLDAYVVGGAVRDELLGIEHADEDFLVPGVDHAGLAGRARAARARRGHGGARPARRRALLPARPRRSGRSSRRDRADAAAGSAASGRVIATSRSSPTPRSRSRTTWRGATSRSTRWPAGSRRASSSTLSAASRDLERRELHTVSAGELPRGPAAHPPRTTARLPARLHARGGHARADARARPPASGTSRGSGSAAGWPRTGMGELSKLLLGTRPARGAPARAGHRRARRVPAGVRAGDRLRPRHRAAAGPARRAPLRRRPGSGRPRRDARASASARCSTTSGSPRRTGRAREHAQVGARVAGAGHATPPLPERRSATRSAGSSRATPSGSTGRSTASSRAGFSPRTGSIVARRAARSTSAPTSPPSSRAVGARAPRAARAALEERARRPHRLADLAVDGDDLLAIGYREGPALGAALARLLDVVIDDPAANDARAPARARRGDGSPERRRGARALPARPRGGGPGVTVVAATKYVPLEDLGVLAEAGVEVVGENRAQDLAAKHAAYGDAFRWHFIGHLQSNKVKARQRDLRARPLARLRVGREPAHGARAARGQPLGRGHEVGRPARGDRRVARAVPGDPRADDDAAARGRPRGVAAVVPPARRSSPPRTAWRSSRWARRRTGASRSRRARR